MASSAPTKVEKVGQWSTLGEVQNQLCLPLGATDYEKCKPGTLYHEGSKVFSPYGAKPLKFENGVGVSVEISPGALVTLDSRLIVTDRRRTRLAVDVLPEKSEENEKDKAGLEKVVPSILGFFSPRIPQELPELPVSGEGKNLIKIIVPGQVHGVDTPQLPAVVNFEWEVGKGQKEPHALYVWPEGVASSVPLVVTSGGSASVPLPLRGRYFWQVEDASGRFVSSPRTIHVRDLAKPLENTADQTAPESGVGSFRMLFPDQKTNIVGCLEKQKYLSMPLKIPVTDQKFVAFSPRITPKNGVQTELVLVPFGEKTAYGRVFFQRAGSYQIRVAAQTNLNSNDAPKSARFLSDLSQVQVINLCPENEGETGPEDFGAIDKIFSDLGTGLGFPARGTLYFGDR